MRIPANTACREACLFVMLFCLSCTLGGSLHVQGAQDADMTGTYTVILYGCNFNEDLETIAFLDREGDQYTIEPYAPDFKYRTRKGMGATDAFVKAEEFIQCNTAFKGSQLREVIAPNGKTVGYEIRPFYDAIVYGAGDVLAVDYFLKGDKVVAQIRLAPSVERRVSGGSSATEK